MQGINPYLTLDQSIEIKIEEKKSVFFGQAKRVEVEEDAFAFIKEIKKKYPDARHHVYAFILGGKNPHYYHKYTDDGEPQGTAGMPVFSALKHANLSDAVLVITRYFGGILLGTGGLVRAYGLAAKLAVEASGIVQVSPKDLYRVLVDYHLQDSLRYKLEHSPYTIQKIDYGMEVDFHILVNKEDVPTLEATIQEWTSGLAIVLYSEEVLAEEKL